MKILLLSSSPNDPNAGASRVYHLLAETLRSQGHDVDLLHLEDFRLPRSHTFNLLVRRIALPQWIFLNVKKRVADGHYDVVMASSGQGCTLYKHLAQAISRPVMINHLHGFAIYDDLAAREESHLGYWPASIVYKIVTGPMQVRWDASGTRRADCTIVQNLRDLSYVDHLAGGASVAQLIPPAIHPDIISASATIKPPEQRAPGKILWFGTWEPRKGAAHVPAAFRQLRSVLPHATLTIGGAGRSSHEIMSCFDKLDQDNISILPRITLEDQISVFNDHAILIFPSLSEGFGIALIEAMCFGCAVVTTKTGFGADFMVDYVHGRIIYPSARHIAQAVEELINDNPLRAKVAWRGRDLARGFTTEDMGISYQDAYLKQIKRRRSGQTDEAAGGKRLQGV